MSEANAGVEGEPASELVLIFEEQRLHVSPDSLPLRLRVAAVPLHSGKELIVTSSPQLNPCVGVVFSPPDGDRGDSAQIVGASVVLGNGEVRIRLADGAAAIVGTIKVIEGRDGQQDS